MSYRDRQVKLAQQEVTKLIRLMNKPGANRELFTGSIKDLKNRINEMKSVDVIGG